MNEFCWVVVGCGSMSEATQKMSTCALKIKTGVLFDNGHMYAHKKYVGCYIKIHWVLFEIGVSFDWNPRCLCTGEYLELYPPGVRFLTRLRFRGV